MYNRNENHFDDVKTNVQAQANESEFKFHYTDDEPVMDPRKEQPNPQGCFFLFLYRTYHQLNHS